MAKILILGRIPPPIGGVTNHVNRLIDNLPKSGFQDFAFFDLSKNSITGIVGKVLKYNIVHLHISRPGLQCLFAVLCKICGKRLIVTYHGNWGRYHSFGNLLVSLSAWLAFIPIVQNDDSLKKAEKWNRRAVNISTHLPAPTLHPADINLIKILEDFRKKHKLVICSNAWNLTFDKNGQEIYGISDLIRRIEDEADTGLIVSDPSGNYRKWIEKQSGSIPANVIFITRKHDFRNILEFSDAFIRNTTTDGVSLSIHEALELNVPVLASSAAARPAFCEVFDDVQKIDFEKSIARARKLLVSARPENPGEEAMEKLVQLYISAMNTKKANVGG